MKTFKQFYEEKLQEAIATASVYEYIPVDKKNRITTIKLQDAKNKGKQDGDKLIAWKYGNLTGKIFTLFYKNNMWN